MSGWGASGTEAPQRLARARDRLLPRDPKHLLAMSFKQRLALRVVLTGEPVVVPGGAVGLDDEVLGGPAEVGDHPTAVEDEWDVDVGVRETAAENEVEDDVLELAAGRGGAGGDDAAEVGRSAPGAEALERLEELANVDEAKRLRLADRPAQAAAVE